MTTSYLSDDIVAGVVEGDVVIVTELLQDSHEDESSAWSVVVELLSRAANAGEALYLGPLFVEDYLVFYGASQLDKLRTLAERSRPFRVALGGVDWAGTQKVVQETLQPLLLEQAEM